MYYEGVRRHPELRRDREEGVGKRTSREAVHFMLIIGTSLKLCRITVNAGNYSNSS
jgi:hypothetical protein